MQKKILMKGNEAVGEGAILAGCRYYFGYPITPQTEISEYLAHRLHEEGGVFIQAESETSAANMLYGAAASGARAMTSSSGPGLSLKQETLSAMAGAQLPCVVVNMMRAGPGVGCIQGAQSDYFQATRGGGHGDYQFLVFAPASVQEMLDLTMEAFIKADMYRMPAMILGDGVLGQMMEPVSIPLPAALPPEKQWSVSGCGDRDKPNIITTLYLDPVECAAHNQRLQSHYAQVAQLETRSQEYETTDARWVLIAYGISARLALSVMQMARRENLPVGVFRPISLWPFPSADLAALAERMDGCMVIEQSAGQMVQDVQLAVQGKVPVHFFGQPGGLLPSPADILRSLKAHMQI